jgi:hypothetical protein
MIGELVMRFLFGGTIVSLFAVFAEMCRPKTFAGVFGAAPSVALVSLVLAHQKQGAPYVALEARSMVAGAVALCLYSSYCVATSQRHKMPIWLSAVVGWAIWLAVSLALWRLVASVGPAS